MMGKRRSSVQLEQEKKSRLQLEERLSDFGWHLTSPSPDLGEDFIVEVYNDGQNTGVTFYIQEKSVANIEERKNKDNLLVYTLKVRDLKHWEGFSLPVVVVVWDVNIRLGKWSLVKDLISNLDQNNPKWRTKNDVQVYIPWNNETTDGGLKRLKVEIGKQVYPLISFGKDLSIRMKLAFPKTPEGMKLQKDFELHIKEGEPVALKGEVIQELKFSDWWETWFGEFDPKVGELYIGETSQDRRVPITFRIIPLNGKVVSLSNLEFTPIRVGTELIKFSNEHTSCPFLFIFSMRKSEKVSEANLTYTVRHVGGESYEILQYLDFAKAMTQGGNLHVKFHDINESISASFPSTNHDPIDPKFYDLVKKLCVIEEKTGRFFRIPKEGISRKDAQAILELFDVAEKGAIHYSDMVLTIELTAEGLKMLVGLLENKKDDEPNQIKATYPESFIDLFDERIQMGPMIREVTGFLEAKRDQLIKTLNVLSPEETYSVKVVKVNGTETFSNWLK